MRRPKRSCATPEVRPILCTAVHVQIKLRDGAVLVGRILQHLAFHGWGTFRFLPLGLVEPMVIDAGDVTAAVPSVGMRFEQRQRIAREQRAWAAQREQETRI